ncbi:MAG: polysaccharide deacetylase family protein [Thermoleophilaceae bacterium]
MNATRRRARLPALKAVAGAPLAVLLSLPARLSARRVGIALFFHGAGLGRGDPIRELLPTHDERLLDAELRHVRRWYRVVPASRLLQAARERRRGQRYPVALTFDDDLASHVHLVLPLLRRHDLPATFFLTGASLHEPFPFWWQDLQALVDREGGDVFALAGQIQGLPAKRRREVAVELRDRAGRADPDHGLPAEAVRELAAAGMEIGFHTREHDPLPTLDDDELERAMLHGRDELEEEAGRPLQLIAYPHGDVDERTPRMARDAGFRYGFTTRIRPVTADSDPMLLGRVEASFRSLGEFAVRLVRALALR